MIVLMVKHSFVQKVGLIGLNYLFNSLFIRHHKKFLYDTHHQYSKSVLEYLYTSDIYAFVNSLYSIMEMTTT